MIDEERIDIDRHDLDIGQRLDQIEMPRHRPVTEEMDLDPGAGVGVHDALDGQSAGVAETRTHPDHEVPLRY